LFKTSYVTKISAIGMFIRKIATIKCHYFKNQDKSVAIFSQQVAAWAPDMLHCLYFMKNHKIANNTTTKEAREKISTEPRICRILEIFDISFTEFKNNKFHKIKSATNFTAAQTFLPRFTINP
jgi:hypothetical protein